MRPTQRIEPMIEALRTAWLANPDQRLGQLIGNAARADYPIPIGEYRDPFDVEDDEIWNGLKKMVNNDN